MGFFDWLTGVFSNTQQQKDDYTFSILESTDNTQGIVVPQDKQKSFNLIEQKLGDKHIVDMKQCEGVYLRYGIYSAIIDKYVDFIVGAGYYVKSDNEKAVKILEDFYNNYDFDEVLREWVRQALIKGFSPLEIGGKQNEIPKGLKVLPAETVFVKRDNKGNIENYNQYGGDVNNIDTSKIIGFKPYQISSLCFNTIPSQFYGYGIIAPNLDNINKVLGLENDMCVLMHRKANNPLHIKMGALPSPQVPNGIKPSQNNIEAMSNKLYNMREKTEWVTGPEVEINTVSFGNVGEKFEYPINHFTQNNTVASQVPDVLLGYGNIAEGLAKEQRAAFDVRIKSFQSRIEKSIEKDIHSRVLLANGIQDTHVEFEWGLPSKEETNTRIQQITQLLTNSMLSPILLQELQEELAYLMGLPITEFETSEQERETEETEELPKVELSMNPDVKIIMQKVNEKLLENKENKENKCNCETQEIDDNILIKEWVGFNLKDYLAYILDVVKNDKFVDLSALTQEQLEAGLLTTPQIEELRELLHDAFEKGKSIKDLSDEINENMTLKDRYVLNDDGTVKRTADGNMVLAVPSANRAKLIARTETVRLANKGLEAQFASNGIKEYQWLTAVSDRTCEACMGLNGNIYSIGKGQLPPLHPNCRCTTLAVIK